MRRCDAPRAVAPVDRWVAARLPHLALEILAVTALAGAAQAVTFALDFEDGQLPSVHGRVPVSTDPSSQQQSTVCSSPPPDGGSSNLCMQCSLLAGWYLDVTGLVSLSDSSAPLQHG